MVVAMVGAMVVAMVGAMVVAMVDAMVEALVGAMVVTMVGSLVVAMVGTMVVTMVVTMVGAMVGTIVATHPWNRVNYTTWRCSNIIQIPYYNLTHGVGFSILCLFFDWDSEQLLCPNCRLSNNPT